VLRLDGQDLTFQSWLERIGSLVGFNSTTFFEAVAAGKPAISLDGLLGQRLAEHRDDFPTSRYPILEYVAQPDSWEALFDVVQHVRSGAWSAQEAYGRREVVDLLRDLYTYPRSVSTLARIVDQVNRDLGGGARQEASEDGGAGFTCVKVKALELATFGLRRDRVISSWFPLNRRQLERDFAAQIRRYVEAAVRFPVSAAGSNGAPNVAAPSGVQDTVAVALARMGSVSVPSGPETEATP
jgi:hypothetical protein